MPLPQTFTGNQLIHARTGSYDLPTIHFSSQRDEQNSSLKMDSSKSSGSSSSSLLTTPYGSALPFAEPSWYGPLGASTSPYYNDSHRRLRAYCREYVDSFADKCGEWEEKGAVPCVLLSNRFYSGSRD